MTLYTPGLRHRHRASHRQCLKIVVGIFTMASEADRQAGWRRLLEGDPLFSVAVPGRPLSCNFNYVFVFGTNATTSHGDSINVAVTNTTENMCDGKSYDWWRFAAQRFRGADLVAKMDSDTIICPSSLLAHVGQAFKLGDALVYMGAVITYYSCGSGDHCPRDFVYAAGGLHFLSADLVAYIDRHVDSSNVVGDEDLVTGTWLHNSSLPIKFINTASWKGRAYAFDARGWTGYFDNCTTARGGGTAELAWGERLEGLCKKRAVVPGKERERDSGRGASW